MFSDMFLGYARHLQELDDIAEYIIQAISSGVTDIDAECIDNLTPSDIKYIEKRVQSYGFDITLSVD